MTTDTKLQELIINKLTTSQYNSIEEKDPNQIYIVTDALGFDNTITNCLTHIPQDIKLELDNGILTLKSSSKVYVPNGFEADGTTPKFDYVTIESDITRSAFGDANGQIFVYFVGENNGIGQGLISLTGSGTSTPTTNYYYNTNDNIIYNSGLTHQISFPLAICSCSNGVVTSIDQVFNGFGYIGSTLFALPGIKGLIPNGRNKDGTLKNIEHIIDKVLTQTFPGSLTRWIIIFSKNNGNLSCPEKYFYVSETQPAVINQTQVWYKPSTNEMFYSDWQNTSTFEKKAGFCCITLNYPTNTTISDFKPYSTFQAVDFNSITQHVVVSTLPANPNSNTFYYIPS